MNSALYIGATGMKGLGEGMNVITHNLANVSTIGYKQQGILFSDLIYTGQGGIGQWWGAQQGSYVAMGQTGKGLQVDSVRTLFGQGPLESSNTVTDMAISGKGFFQVSDKGKVYYTRAGDFRFDDKGVLRTPEGMALNGYKCNADGSRSALGQVTVEKFSTMPPKATTAVDIRSNLGQSAPHSADPVNPYFSLLGLYQATAAPPLADTAYGHAQSIQLYGSDGAPRTATVYFDAAPDGTSGNTVQYLVAANPDARGEGAGALMAGTLSFTSNGQFKDMSAFTPAVAGSANLADWVPAALSADGLPQMSVGGATVSLNLGLRSSGGWANAPASAAAVGLDPAALPSMGDKAVRSQDATTNYTAAAPATRVNSQNGYPEGRLNRIQIMPDGTVTGMYSNSQNMDLWQIPVCRFTSEDGLRREGHNLFSAAPEAGNMEMGVAGTENYGTIRAYNIEQSNVDMAAEMVNMIITQRGFQSNSKVVTTADQMLQRAVELKRS